jgi:hypothetical protein
MRYYNTPSYSFFFSLSFSHHHSSPDQSPSFIKSVLRTPSSHCLRRDTSFCFSLFPLSLFFSITGEKDTAYSCVIDAYDFRRRHDQTTHHFFLNVHYIASSFFSSQLAVLRMTSQLSSLICT